MSETINNAPASEILPDAAPEAAAEEQDAAAESKAANPADPKAEAKPAEIKQAQKDLEKRLEKFKIKVDGEESEEELDLNDKEAIKKHLQMSKASQKRMQESAQLRKEVENFVSALKTDTRRVLQEMGIDPKEFATGVINQEIQELQKSPEQREKEQHQKEIEELRKRIAADEESKKQAEYSRMQEKFAFELDRDITSALTSSQLPKSPYVVKRIADTMALALEHGHDVSVGDILPLVEKQIKEEIQNMFGAMPEEALEAVLGKQNADRLRKNRLSKMKKAIDSPSKAKETGESSKASQSKEDKKVSAKDFFRSLGNK